MAPRKLLKHRSAKIRKPVTKLSSTLENEEVSKEYDFLSDPTSYFLNIASFDAHFEAQKNHRNKYLATVLQLVSMKIELLPSAKVKAITCSWARNDQEMANAFLSMSKIFNFVEVAKAINLLDIPRQIRATENKINKLKQLEEQNKITVKLSTYKTLAKKISILDKQKLNFGSVTGALCRHVRKWASKLSESELEFIALNFETSVWKEMADIVHFNPEKNFSNLPWFLPYCFGKSAPDISTVERTKNLNSDNVNEILKSTPLPFHKISKFKQFLTNESKTIIVRNEDNVGRAIWWYEDLECQQVDEIILERLCSDEELEFGYGKLMERLMMLKPKNVCFYPKLMEIAESKLNQYSHCLEGPIGVLADASSSMDVAIRTATIISSFLTVFTNAQLIFFNDNCWIPNKNPTSISDVIELALNTHASNSTSPAAALWYFYKKKTHLKTIIMVTDEEENTDHQEYNFTTLFKKYVEEIGPCKLIFISFLSSQHSQGQMVTVLRSANIDATQYVFNSIKPDISKLDSIIGKMSLNNSRFLEAISTIETLLGNEKVETVFGTIGQ